MRLDDFNIITDTSNEVNISCFFTGEILNIPFDGLFGDENVYAQYSDFLLQFCDWVEPAIVGLFGSNVRVDIDGETYNNGIELLCYCTINDDGEVDSDMIVYNKKTKILTEELEMIIENAFEENAFGRHRDSLEW